MTSEVKLTQTQRAVLRAVMGGGYIRQHLSETSLYGLYTVYPARGGAYNIAASTAAALRKAGLLQCTNVSATLTGQRLMCWATGEEMPPDVKAALDRVETVWRDIQLGRAEA